VELAAEGALITTEPVVERARAWIEADPDPDTRAELEELINAGALDELADRMDGSLAFGTAGIRGEVAAGPNRMNRAVVIRTTRGLVEYLVGRHDGAPSSPVVLGFDARPSSRQFAEDTAGVIAAAGIPVLFFPEVTPTPLVAFACVHLGAVSAVVITASHNPPADNGYKVYAANGAQIIPPMDLGISSAIDGVGPANEIPRIERAFDSRSDLITPVPDDLFEAYWEQVDRSRPSPRSSDLKIIYTPIHGVGGEPLEELFRRAGHSGLRAVPEQAQPDGMFPTVAFPNPEEEGALDLAIDMATREGADLVIANDPDADRFAAVIPYGSSWRPLTGNEVGVLLGDYVLRHYKGHGKPIVINSIVSSPMLGEIAAHHNAHFERTLTGFKWISNAGMALEAEGVGNFVFGYEEALGYTVGSTVRDKDGLATALIFVDLLAGLNSAGHDLLDRLAELWEIAGVWGSAQHSIVRQGAEGQDKIELAIDHIAENPPQTIQDFEVTEVTDYRSGASSRPMWLGEQQLVELTLGSAGRILVRPSGTEPKLKIYVDLVAKPGTGPEDQQRELQAKAGELASRIEELLPA
jgi:phosphomannomutase